MNILLKFRLFLHKLTHYEFWPFWLFYMPMYFSGMILALRARSATYFTAANPVMKYGGAFDMRKFEILQRIRAEYIPAGVLVSAETGIQKIMELMGDGGLKFPVVAKPDIGERGRHVELIEDTTQLADYMDHSSGQVILQEYIQFPLELGILYYRYPDGSGEEITSVVIRDFLKVRGDGKKTLRKLLAEKLRAMYRRKYLFEKYKDRLDTVIPEGEEILLEPIGNHVRGTRFLNGNHLIDDRMMQMISGIAAGIPGFDYGRFDMKTTSLDNFFKGKDIMILEVNGTNSEPAHIYDPDWTLCQAYRDIYIHMKIIHRISRMNHRKGVPYAPLKAFTRDLLKHLYHARKCP